jgi:histidine triad (HIT) family protein
MAFEDSCIFCKIVQKQAPASIIYEDQFTMAFLDIRPLTMGHTLVISKGHYTNIFDIPKEALCQIHITAKHVAKAVKTATKADGISIFQQNGRAAGQDIFHIHVHVVPRFEGQGLSSFSSLELVDRDMLDNIAKKVVLHL